MAVFKKSSSNYLDYFLSKLKEIRDENYSGKEEKQPTSNEPYGLTPEEVESILSDTSTYIDNTENGSN